MFLMNLTLIEINVLFQFLKKLNRQERVVDEVKTVLKPHYARKHITKEEYKDILRRSVPKVRSIIFPIFLPPRTPNSLHRFTSKNGGNIVFETEFFVNLSFI